MALYCYKHKLNELFKVFSEQVKDPKDQKLLEFIQRSVKVRESLITAMYSLALCQEFTPGVWNDVFNYVMGECFNADLPKACFTDNNWISVPLI